MTTYKIIRFYRDDARPKEIQDSGLTLEEAQAWCQDPTSHGEGWFDGYEREADTEEDDQ